MNPNPDYTLPAVDSILLPSDFSAGSQTAFYHALKAALIAKSKFTILHVSSDGQAHWSDFPGVRDTLERWGLLAPGSPKSAVPQLGIDVSKAVARGDSPLKSVLGYLETHPADLIVLATHSHGGRASWLLQSVAEPIARKAGQMTLFIPDAVKGFVGADGSISLTSIVIPIAAQPRPEPALAAAARLASRLQCQRGHFTLLYVGEAGSSPEVQCPEVPGWEWKKITKTGDVVGAILETARDQRADLIVMSTKGHHGFLDALRGSHSEKVLHKTPCPLLTVPECSLAAGALV